MKTALFIAFFLIATLAPAQNSQRSSQQPPPPSAQAGAQKPGTGQSSKKDEPEKEHIVTAQETKELFQSVDEILHFASKDTLLPIKHPVKKAMVSRAEVEKYGVRPDIPAAP